MFLKRLNGKCQLMKYNICVISIVVLAVLSGSRLNAAVIDVYLLAGQSNMGGQGVQSEVSPSSVLYPEGMLFHSSGIYDPTEALTWVPMRPAPQYNLPSYFGPEIGFVNRMNELAPDRQIAVIKHAKGGTSLQTDWAPGTGSHYNTFVSTVHAGLNALIAQGHTPVIKAMIWHQGEKDSHSYTDSSNYDDNLVNLIASIRAEFNVPEMPFVYGHVLPVVPAVAGYAYRDVVRQAQLDVDMNSGSPYATAGAYLVNTDGLTLHSDLLHFNTAGQLELGARFADTIDAICSLDFDFTGPAGIPDGVVDLYDLAELADSWLDSYDLYDFAEFAKEWLDSN